MFPPFHKREYITKQIKETLKQIPLSPIFSLGCFSLDIIYDISTKTTTQTKNHNNS